MASAYGIRREFGEPVQVYDFNFMTQVGSYKQGEVTKNRMAINALKEQYFNLALAKPQDREYFHSRINALLDEVDANWWRLDMSKASVGESIQNHIKQALDTNVMTAYAGTMAGQRLMEEIEYFKKNKSDQYSTQNEWDAMRGYREWLSDGQVGSSYGGGSYTPYTDLQAKYTKALNDFSKLQSETEVEIPRDGYLVKIKKSDMTQAEISNFVTRNLSPQDRVQLGINARYNNQGATDEQVSASFDSYVNGKLDDMDKQIDMLRTEMSGKSDVDKEVYKNQIKLIEENKKVFATNSANLKGSRDGMLYTMEAENFVEGMKSFAWAKESQTYDKDDTWFAHQNLAIARFNAETARINATKNGSGGSSSSSAPAKGTAEYSSYYGTQGAEKLDEGSNKTLDSAYDTYQTRKEKAVSDLNNSTLNLKNKLFSNSSFKNIYDDIKGKNPSYNDATVMRLALEKAGTSLINNGLLTQDELNKHNKKANEVRALYNKERAIVSNNAKGMDISTEDWREIYDYYKDSRYGLVMLEEGGLQGNTLLSNVSSFEDFMSEKNAPIRRQIAMSHQSHDIHKILSENESYWVQRGNLDKNGVVMSEGNYSDNKVKLDVAITNLYKSVGGKKSLHIEDIFDVTAEKGLLSLGSGKRLVLKDPVKIKDPNVKRVIEYLGAVDAHYVRDADRSPFNRVGDVLSVTGDQGDIVINNAYKSMYNFLPSETNRTFTDEKSPLHRALYEVIAAEGASDAYAKANLSLTYNRDANAVTIKAVTKGKNGADVERVFEGIDMNRLIGHSDPNVANAFKEMLTTQVNDRVHEWDTMQPFTKSVKFPDDVQDSNLIQSIANTGITQSSLFAVPTAVTENQFVSMMQNSFGTLLFETDDKGNIVTDSQNTPKDSKYGTLIKAIADHSSNFDVTFNGKEGQIYADVYFTDLNNNRILISSIPTQKTNVNANFEAIEMYSQGYLYHALRDVFSQKISQNTNTSNRILNTLFETYNIS